MLKIKNLIRSYLKRTKNNNLLTSNILFFFIISILSGCAEDKTPPTITLVGSNEINWTQGYPYNDLGANAVDLVDGKTQVSLSGNVDVNVLGSYQLTYTAADMLGNKNSVTRKVNVVAPTSFITKWNTNGDITINTSGNGYDFSIDWGDGTVEHHQSQGIKHTYASAGVKTITISGVFPHFMLNEDDAKELLSVEQWGNNHWTSMEKMFESASNMVLNAKDIPVLYQVTSMKDMFFEASSFNQYIGDWDVSNVTNMSGMFSGVRNGSDGKNKPNTEVEFNQDISEWDVSNVTDMSRMFHYAKSFNQNISAWDVSNVTDMSYMFNNAKSFNQNISDWDVSNIKDMSRMFHYAQSFDQNISGWNVSNVTDMRGMFGSTRSFNQDISNWNVSNVTDMGGMFEGANSFNQDISDWNVSNVTDMRYMFSSTRSFNQDISDWNVSNVTDMKSMFSYAMSFNQNISDWDVSNVKDMSYMFADDYYSVHETMPNQFPYIGFMVFNQYLSDWDVSNVTDMSSMFSFTRLFNQNLSNWDVSNVDDMSDMFLNAGLSFKNYDALLNGWSGKASTKEIPLQRRVRLGASAFYSDASEDARDSLEYDHNWRIESAGYIDTLKPDTTLPWIALNGEDTLELSVGDDYIEYGGLGIDDRDGTFYATIEGEVDTDTPGKYILTYIAKDKAGNTTKAVTRAVTVKLKEQ